MENKYWKIYAGLGGGFGGAQYRYTTEEPMTEEEASEEAYQAACEYYDSHSHDNSLFNRKETLEEDPDLTEEDLDEMYQEDLENWIECWVEEATGPDDIEE